MTFSIRPVQVHDAPALSRICLLTANFGTSAEHLHKYKELPGLVYAIPYCHLPTAFGYVLVSDEKGEDSVQEVEDTVGYVLGTTDTKAFQAAAESHWYPPLRAEYPQDPATDSERLEGDKYYIGIIHVPHKTPPELVAWSPAHIHIDILPEAQRQGWGRRLIDTAVQHLLKEVPETRGLWVGLDPRNEEAKKFYRRIGFQHFPTGDGEYFILKFNEWKT